MTQDGFMRYDATSGNAIEATGLIKRFGKTTALAGVDLVAREGRVLGVLGPNGAGKTTAVRILATLLRPDAGQARVCGHDLHRNAYQVVAAYPRLPCVGPQQGGQDPDRGRLAGSVGAQDAEHPALPGDQVDSSQRRRLTEPLDQPGGLDRIS